MNIFIGTNEVAGYYIKLYKALKDLNIKVDYYCKYHPFEYASLKDYPTLLGKCLYIITKYK